MKKTLFFTSFILILLILTGCSGKPYTFKNPVDEIESIEIVSAETSLEFTVTKILSETEKKNFLEQFRMMKFNTYYVGDPMSVNGTSVKITYCSGDYEIICHYWAEYVENGEVYFVWKNCNEDEFNELINRFLY